MNRNLVFSLMLAVGAALHANAADPTRPGFLPLTPDGYPVNASSPPAATPPVAPALTPTPTLRPAATVVATTAGTTNATMSSAAMDDRHNLAAGDKVSFTILEDRFFPNLTDNRYAPPATITDLSKALVVADTGELDFPYVGRVKVAGRTCKDVAAEVKTALEKDYYQKATVVLGLDQMSREQGRVWISGEVRSPGAVNIPPTGNFTAGKAILGAGGFTDWAKKKEVQIVRKSKTAGTAAQTFTVDLEQVLEKGRADKDVALEPEDYIIVPRAFIRL